MFPERVPERIRLAHGHEAEVEFFGTLQDELDRRFRAFCWIPLLQLNKGIRQSEVDFVVLDPKRGYLALEVKGGAVGRGPDSECPRPRR